MNNRLRNQLTAEDVGSIMLFEEMLYGEENQIFIIYYPNYITQLPRNDSRWKRAVIIAD